MRRITLEALGLSEKEHTVLTVLQLQSMAQKISRISIQAKLPQSTTSFILRKLEKRKLVTCIKVKNHFRWKYRKNLDVIENSLTKTSKTSFLVVADGMVTHGKNISGGSGLHPVGRCARSGLRITVHNPLRGARPVRSAK